MSVTTSPAQPAPDLVVVSCGDNRVFMHETLGRLWRRIGWPFAANKNPRVYPQEPFMRAESEEARRRAMYA